MAAKTVGKKLAKEWGIQVAQARYREDGTWYHTLNEFPAALLDKNGYIVFATQEEYDECEYLNRSKTPGKDWLVPTVKYISKIPGYKSNSSNIPATQAVDHPLPGEDASMWEGGAISAVVHRYERDPKARKTCIQKFGTTCAVCDLDFSHLYGEIGRGFIHVHHLKPLSAIREQYRIDPIRDLRPVCPNCHAMLHTRGPEPFSIGELKAHMQMARKRVISD